MAISDDIVNILTDFGKDTKEDLQKSLRDKGVTFGGQDSKLSNSIKYEVTNQGGTIKFKLIVSDYGEILDKGRKAAGVSKDGQKKIKEWTKRKAIVGSFRDKEYSARLRKQSESKRQNKKKLKKMPFDKAADNLTYLISRKLKQKGYKGNKWYSSIVTDERLKELQDKLTAIIKQDVQIEVVNAFKI